MYAISCSVDATKSKALCRCVNDIDVFVLPNTQMRIVEHGGQPHLCLFASEDIKINTELRYDYGFSDVPWRKKVIN